MSLASGSLYFLAFPKWNFGFLAWVALIPLLIAAYGKSSRQVFALGFFAGWAALCGVLYWITPTFQAAGVSTALGLLSVALLAGYIALYFGAFACFYNFVAGRFPQFALILASAAWVALEWARNYLFGGFPWGSLAYSQWQYWPLIQISEFTGFYGVSFILCAVNIFLYESAASRQIRRHNFGLICTFLALNLWAFQGEKSHAPSPEALGVKTIVLQGNIDQYQKWNDEYVESILDVYESLLKSVPSTDLIIWPETALPGWIPNDPKILAWAQERVRKSGTYHLIGAVTEDGASNYNSAFLFSPDGNIVGRYDKMHLVPFGEFVPAKTLLGRWISVLNDLGGFNGGRPGQILEHPQAKIGAGICYESVFPEIARAQVKSGAEILVNITNDGWYLDTAAPEQHFAMNVFRSVENRRTLVRAANTGISGLIAPSGKVLERTGLGERTFFEARVVKRKDLHLFTRAGDWFPILCAIMALAGLFIKRKMT
ncbi:MAG: apolipoprotein N-acyltransferase [Elusimicrobia bacterium RIFCSPLOWO2_01_FULL_54_10]|nr:MAG: apolipoprotein N-acyltransferase [Elusimicrobia bacterium RIFCSPLOWO2_01_FULL_54_10]